VINTVAVAHKFPLFGEVLAPLWGTWCPLWDILCAFVAAMDLNISVNLAKPITPLQPVKTTVKKNTTNVKNAGKETKKDTNQSDDNNSTSLSTDKKDTKRKAKQVSTKDDNSISVQIAQINSAITEQRKLLDVLIARLDFLTSFVGIDTNQLAAQSSSSASTYAAMAASAPATHQPHTDRRSEHGSNAGSSNQRSPAEFNAAVMSAVYADQDTKKRRENSVIVSGLPCPTDCDDTASFHQLCVSQLHLNPDISHCRRLGTAANGRPQQLLVVMRSSEIAQEVICRSKFLRPQLNGAPVYVSRNLTKAEAHAAYDQRCRRRQKEERRRTASSNVVPAVDLSSKAPLASAAVPRSSVTSAVTSASMMSRLCQHDSGRASHNQPLKPSAVSSAVLSTSAATAAPTPPVLASTAAVGLSLPTPTLSASTSVPSRLRWVMPSNQQSDPVRQQLPVVSMDLSRQYYQEPVQTLSTQLQFDVAPTLQHMMAYPPPPTVAPFHQSVATSVPATIPLPTYHPSMIWPPQTSAVA